MPGVLDVDFQFIQGLNATDLTRLLKTLLHLEMRKYELETSSVFVSLKIEVPDGGEDGRVEWEDGPKNAGRIPKRFTIFQSKAEKNMTATDFANACVNKIEKANTKKAVKAPAKSKQSDKKNIQTATTVKPALKECAEKNGSYVFFYSSPFNTNQQKTAITKIKTALQTAKMKDVSRLDIKIFDANRIADWVNEHLSAQLLVRELSKYPAPIDLRTWDSWYRLENPRFKFATNSETGQRMKQLQEHVAKPRSTIRVVGLPFMGKSRFVLEALGDRSKLKAEVIYFDVKGTGKEEISSFASDSVQNDLGAILIIDNCPLEFHKVLAKICKDSKSKLSLLTIGSDPEENSGEERINITASDDVIQNILEQAYGDKIIPADLTRIIEFAQGFPGMAVLLADARLENNFAIGQLTDDTMLKKLLGAVSAENQAYTVIQACALFKNFGFDDDLANERKFIADNLTSLSDNEFYGFVRDFMQRRIVQEIGSYAAVVPRPLALRLAADWWSRTSSNRAKQLMGGAMPERLLSAFAEQVSLLNYLPQVKTLAEDFFLPDAPFGSAEVLNTEIGSRLFRSLADVTPVIAVNGLRKVFQDLTQKDLLEIGPGRRNIIRTLQKLAFSEETFMIAGEMLLRLAASENEAWNNNATGQFLQLFHVLLPGTSVPLEDRLQLIDLALNDVRPDYKILGLKALGEALKEDHFARTGGGEIQGSGPANDDYIPKNEAEFKAYWMQCLNRLFQYLELDNDLGTIARQQLTKRLYGLVRWKYFNSLDKAFKAVLRHNGFWSEGYKTMQLAVQQFQGSFSEIDIARLRSLLEIVSPKTWQQKIEVWVDQASYNNLTRDESGNVTDGSKVISEEFARECASSWPQWRDDLSRLFIGKQNYGFSFGVELGRVFKQPKLFTDLAIESLKKLPEDKANPTILGAFLRGANKDSLTIDVLNQLCSNGGLYKFVIPVAALTGVSKCILNDSLNLAKQRKINVSQLGMFAYGSVLSHLPADDVNEFAHELVSIPGGNVVALAILFMYCFGQPSSWKVSLKQMREILFSLDISSIDESHPHMDFYHWHESATKVLSLAETPDLELAAFLINEIIKCLGGNASTQLGLIESCFKPLLKVLLSGTYRDAIWPIIARAAVSDDFWVRSRLQILLGKFYAAAGEDENTILGALPEAFLLDWCERDRNVAVFMSRAIPLIEKIEKKWQLTSLAKSVIKNFGDDEEVLQGLSLNFGSVGGWEGSMELHFHAQIEALKPLLISKNSAVAAWASKQTTTARKSAEWAAKRHTEFKQGIFD